VCVRVNSWVVFTNGFLKLLPTGNALLVATRDFGFDLSEFVMPEKYVHITLIKEDEPHVF
jgi:hypothetical protein